MDINFKLNLPDRVLVLRIHIEFLMNQNGKEGLLLTIDSNNQSGLEKEEIKELISIFERLLEKNAKSVKRFDDSDTTKDEYIIHKKFDILIVLNLLLDEKYLADDNSKNGIKFLSAKKENPIYIINQNLARKSRVKKQKTIFADHEKVAAGPDNKYHEAKRNRKSYIVRPRHLSSVAAVSAFASYVCLLAIGQEHSIKTHFMTDSNNLYAGIFSKKAEVRGTLDSLARENQLPTQDELIEAGLIEILVALWAFADMDGHSNNIFLNKKNNLVLFDFDRWFFSLTCLYLNIDPNKPHHYGGTERSAPKDAFPITIRDMKNFPLIMDAKPFWWLLNAIEFMHRGTKVTNRLYEHLKGIEKNPKVQYRAYRAFIRIALFQKYNIVAFAEANFRRKERGDNYVKLCMERVRMIREGFRQIEAEEHFIEKNPQVFEDVLAEFVKYNKCIRDKDEEFRVSLDLVREQMTYLFKPTEVRLKHAHESLARAAKKFSEIKAKYPQNSPEMLIFKVNMATQLEKLKKALGAHQEKSGISLDAIQDDIDVLNIELDLSDKKLLTAFKVIEKVSIIRDKLTKIYLFIRLTGNDQGFSPLLDDIDSIHDDICGNNLIAIAKQLQLVQLRLGTIEATTHTYALNLNRIFFHSSNRQNSNQNQIDMFLENITQFLKTSPTDLLKKYPNPALHKIYNLWFYQLAIEGYNKTFDELHIKSKSSLGQFKFCILKSLKKIINNQNLKIDTILEISDIIRLLEKNQTDIASLKCEIEHLLKGSKKNLGFSNSDLKEAVFTAFREYENSTNLQSPLPSPNP